MLTSNRRSHAAAVFALVIALSAAKAASAGSSIAHNRVVAIPSNASQVEFDWQPQLKVYQGCHPFPAVDTMGNWSGGLKDSGGLDSGCDYGTGQVYVRGMFLSATTCAIMYAWYFPKDSSWFGQGHRHDWESVVLFLKDGGCDSINARHIGQVHAVAYSQHGSYEKIYAPSASDFTATNLKALYKKVQYAGFGNHSMNRTSEGGGYQPLVAWTHLSQEARNALNTVDFGAANCPINDSNFEPNVAKARPNGI